MKTHGQYYSSALMYAMMSHSLRWARNDVTVAPYLEPFDGGRDFFKWAISDTLSNIQNGQCTITTIQTLLLLSAQECGRGHRSQAWMFCGMAIRLVEDMGLNIDGRKYPGSAQLNDEDIEIRSRIYWSTFVWEKIICLYFGRTPMLRNTSMSPPQVISKSHPTHPKHSRC
jgi:hypothetical protein